MALYRWIDDSGNLLGESVDWDTAHEECVRLSMNSTAEIRLEGVMGGLMIRTYREGEWTENRVPLSDLFVLSDIGLGLPGGGGDNLDTNISAQQWIEYQSWKADLSQWGIDPDSFDEDFFVIFVEDKGKPIVVTDKEDLNSYMRDNKNQVIIKDGHTGETIQN